MIRAAIAKAEGDHSQAVDLHEQVLTNNRYFMVDVLPALLDSYRQLDQLDQFEQYLSVGSRASPP